MESKSFFSSLPVTCHTDYVIDGSTFVAINGTKLNGNDFITIAIKKGATKIVVQKDSILSNEILNLINSKNIELVKVNDCRLALAELSAQAWNYPSKKLKIIGVTGTKGKTTSTFLLHHLLNSAGHKTAMLTGVYNVINDEKYSSSLTTPLPDYLHAFFNKCVQENVEYVVMEAAAQAFSLRRLKDIEFSGVIFSNLDLEHMEFYSSMEEYFEAKCEIFNQLKENAPVVINIDNSWCFKISQKNSGFVKVSLKNNKNSDFLIEIKKNDLSGLELVLKNKNNVINFYSPLIGEFNAYNISCVIALCSKLGIKTEEIINGLKSFSFVPGRMESYSLSNGALAIVDYAHNPSSFSNVLPTIKTIGEKLIVVFGAGGDRDKQKRPIMGDIASKIADKVIITSDNPRSEKVQDIIDQILSGISTEKLVNVICEIDRAKAIQKAYQLSKKGDVIAILGKGPDEYEIVGDQKFYFSDKETIISCK